VDTRLIALGVFVLLVLVIIVSSSFTIETAEVGVVQRLGKFYRVAGPGLNTKMPFIDTLTARLSLKIQQLTVQVETKTKDNVFVQIPVSIQYQIIPEKVYDAFYRLSEPTRQIESFVYNAILGHVPGMTLDEVFSSQAQIALDVQQNLDASMREFGYTVVKALVTDVVPDAKVKSAMNDINAAQREREATVARGETEKILAVKKAEAEAESKRLQGEGIANQRRAIIAGLQESVESFQKAIEGVQASDVMALVLITQYFDTMRDIGASANSNTILLPHSPGAVRDLMSEIREGVLTGQLTANGGIPKSGNGTAAPQTT
jgi:regulator of protease activity HflC (stomatin/prohibitin superfamily)